MKKIIYFLLSLFILGNIFSCKDMDDIYEEFIVPNGLTYPQKPDSLKVYAGYNKLRLYWLKAKDPSVIRGEVYWNNYHDTLKIDIPKNKDTIFVDIENLNEGTYTFHVKTFDEKNNASIPSEVTGTSYGEYYVMAATDRTYTSAVRDDKNKATIEWGTKTADLVYSEVRYKTTSNQIKTIRVLPEDKISTLSDVKSEELFEYRSVFLPPNGIDSVARDWAKSKTPFVYKYPRTGWTGEARNGNHDWGDGGGGQPSLVFDGDMATGWHSKVGAEFPQCFVVDMKQPLFIDYITISPPEKASWRYLKNVEVYISDKPITPDTPQPSWGNPVAKAQYSGEDHFDLHLKTPVKGQYVALVFLDSTSAYISFMEFNVYGY